MGKFVHVVAHSAVAAKGGILTMQDFSGISYGLKLMTSNEDFSMATSLTNPTIPAEFRNANSARVVINFCWMQYSYLTWCNNWRWQFHGSLIVSEKRSSSLHCMRRLASKVDKKGFPREIEQDFKVTKRAIQEICFSEVEIGKYEDTPRTEFSLMKDKIPQEIIDRRSRKLKRAIKSLA